MLPSLCIMLQPGEQVRYFSVWSCYPDQMIRSTCFVLNGSWPPVDLGQRQHKSTTHPCKLVSVTFTLSSVWSSGHDTVKMPPKYKNLEDRQKAKAAQDRERGLARVNIKSQLSRWQAVGKEKDLSSNEEIANFLLDL